MDNTGKILIADDKEIFLNSLADLLRDEGYPCDCAKDSGTAIELIQKNHYDLLIADILMPGNEKLEFIHRLPEIARGLPVIIVTAHPSLESAIQSIHLPVIAYLVKPIDFDELKVHVKTSMDRSHVYQLMLHSRTRLINWQHELTAMIEGVESDEVARSAAPMDAFLTMTFQNINSSLSEIRELTETMGDTTSDDYICRILKCPRAIELTDGLREAVKVLVRTKSSFKSKALADLREKLSTLLEKIDK